MAFTFDENGALLVSGPIGGIGVATRVAFWTAAQTLGSNANLYWDNVNEWLGIGDVPDSMLLITQNVVNADTLLKVKNDNVGSTGVAAIIRQDGTGDILQLKDGGSDVVVVQDGGYTGFNTTPNRRTHAMDDSASANAIIPISRIESQVSGGAGAAGHGPGFEYTSETSTTEDTLTAVTAARWSVATHASRRARFEIRNYYIGNEVLCGVIEAPANASVDGNARGVAAVDFQGYRTGVAQVAAAPYSVLIGGRESEIAGNSDGVAVLGGYSHSVGASALYCGVVSGYGHFVDGSEYGGTLGGREGHVTNYGQIVRASGMFSTEGDAQSSDYVARIDLATHILNNWNSLYLDGAAAQMLMATSTAWTFRALVVGLTANAAQQWSYEIVGLIEQDNAAVTTLAASTTTTIFESDANYDAQAVADNVNNALEIQVRRTGGVDYSVQWVATIMVAECSH